jgi:hypothetical protein
VRLKAAAADHAQSTTHSFGLSVPMSWDDLVGSMRQALWGPHRLCTAEAIPHALIVKGRRRAGHVSQKPSILKQRADRFGRQIVNGIDARR